MATTKAATLTRDDVRNLKAAEGVCFMYRDGKSTIKVLLKNGSESYIECATLLTSYSQNLEDISDADYSILHTEFDHVYRTMVNCMMEGDSLTLCWSSNNDSGVMRAVGLHRDDLHLRIDRIKGVKTKRFDFHVATKINTNNPVRMIRLTDTPKLARR